MRQGRESLFPSSAHITRGFLFSRLQNRVDVNFFFKLMLAHGHEVRVGCYIVFSGFSTAQVILAQEPNLHPPYVTAGTAAHSKR
jgi:hypothetical protein